MILQALYHLARYEGLLDDPDFEWKPIAWLVTVDDGGKFLGLQGTHFTPEAEEGSKKRPKPRAKSFPVPREEGRTSGDRAFFLFDKSEYALGLDAETDPARRRPAEKLAARFALSRQRAEACLEATGDPGVRAVVAFLRQLADGALAVALPAECTSNDLFTFVYRGDEFPITSRPAVQDYWRSLRAQSAGTTETGVRCLVSGQPCEPVGKHPMIKNVPGGSTSGIALVSFNSNAFESFGWAGNDNAPVSREAAEAVSTALNRLLHPAFPNPREPGQTLPSRHLRLSETTTVCFWAPAPAGDDLASALLGLLDANPDSVRELYRSLWKGSMTGIDDPTAFYALTLSGSQGRAILRDWLESSVRDVARNLARHFEDLAIVRNTPAPKGRELPPALPLRVLLRSLAPQGDDKKIPAALAADLLHCALRGQPYPLAILQRALERARAEIGADGWADLERRDARAALLKAVLNRRRRFHLATTAYPEVKESMDPTNPNPGYRLGRLMAVIERTQQLALKDVNASVVDRYFSAASASPQSVFPRLLKGMRHHVRKAKDDSEERTSRYAVKLDRLADEILSLFDPKAPFPSYLSLDDQGLFILGYHQQRHDFFKPREDRQDGAAETAAALSEPISTELEQS
jgi:CRISPR-associated protein Csd1